MNPGALCWTLYLRELRLASRRRLDLVLPWAFLVAAAVVFPLAVGPEPELLRRIAPGVVWACSLLAALLSVGSLYAGDHADGSLEQMLCSGRGAGVVVVAKVLAHWSLTGVPLALLAPAVGAALGLPASAWPALGASLLLGTPVLSLLGALAAALTLGLRGSLLVVLLVLPLAVPVLVFGTGAVAAVEGGQSPAPYCALLAAVLMLTALVAVPAGAAALRLSME
ncbi:heme exporter protein CcmB [Caldimonas thermodepolymerans]|uniref:heme exporter protein CcmB n=1 Tax=Caldimonas thermodepolymerans TaxID=215580 RepID=UPI000E2C882B|nr:heme exporter protein CcmB [Caldimonas thermodepolymerans]RDI00569.1 heme exporter protein B [Caldimonas thermodepolymerans]UZG42942.1 heme exporter protein CcmB [Caldimonas thermodepolymerans]